MRFDKQTLAWINKHRRWMALDSVEYGMGGAVVEGAAIPDMNFPTISIYYDEKSGKSFRFRSFDWGKYAYQHSIHLVKNECKCSRCLGNSYEFDPFYLIKKQFREKGLIE